MRPVTLTMSVSESERPEVTAPPCPPSAPFPIMLEVSAVVSPKKSAAPVLSLESVPPTPPLPPTVRLSPERADTLATAVGVALLLLSTSTPTPLEFLTQCLWSVVLLCSSVESVFVVFDASDESNKELFVLSLVESFEFALFEAVSLLDASVKAEAADCASLSVALNVLVIAIPEDESDALAAVIVSLPAWSEA